VKESLANARSRITLSFDAWSSLNHYSLLGVVAYWIDSKRELRTGLLAIKVLKGYYGFEMAEVLNEVINNYSLDVGTYWQHIYRLGVYSTYTVQ
jgi:hypothetical protein